MYVLQNSVRMFHPLWMGGLGHFSETATTHPPGCDWLIKNAYKKIFAGLQKYSKKPNFWFLTYPYFILEFLSDLWNWSLFLISFGQDCLLLVVISSSNWDFTFNENSQKLKICYRDHAKQTPPAYDVRCTMTTAGISKALSGKIFRPQH